MEVFYVFWAAVISTQGAGRTYALMEFVLALAILPPAAFCRQAAYRDLAARRMSRQAGGCAGVDGGTLFVLLLLHLTNPAEL